MGLLPMSDDPTRLFRDVTPTSLTYLKNVTWASPLQYTACTTGSFLVCDIRPVSDCSSRHT